MTLLQDDHNIPLIEQDLASSWWANHAFIDPFAGTLVEYFSEDRSDTESYLQKWDRWVNDDYYKSYIEQLGKLGLNMSTGPFKNARQRIADGLIHRTAIFAFAIWPLAYWRFDGLNERDFEWFEARYPGWYDEYGMLWEAFNALKDPREGALFLNGFLENASPICWSCMMQCLGDHDQIYRVVDDRTRFYCSHECCANDVMYPYRYTGDRQFFDKYHGWSLADVVRDIGFVRADGKTLVGQPHLDDDKPLWTLDDLEQIGCEITSPNIRTAQEMGLPNGSSHNPDAYEGAAIQGEHGYVPWASIGGDGLETGAHMKPLNKNGNGRKNVAEVIL
jgi:propane monooxygenase large subunit